MKIYQIRFFDDAHYCWDDQLFGNSFLKFESAQKAYLDSAKFDLETNIKYGTECKLQAPLSNLQLVDKDICYVLHECHSEAGNSITFLTTKEISWLRYALIYLYWLLPQFVRDFMADSKRKIGWKIWRIKDKWQRRFQ